MSAVKKIHGRHARKQAATTMAGCGRAVVWNLATGWHKTSKSAEVIFAGMPVKGAVQIACGYGQYAAVRQDGSLQIGGQNAASNLPWTTGPEAPWAGAWEPRYPIDLSFEEHEYNLPQQNAYLKGELGPVVTAAQLIVKEQKFEIEERSAQDTEKACYGQIVYPVGITVTNPKVIEGKFITTWVAIKKNVLTEPGTDPTVWIPKTPEVAMFEKTFNEGTEEEFTRIVQYAYNLALPITAPQIKNVKEVSMVGEHGAILLKDGTIRMWGHGVRYGGFAQACHAGYGPKKSEGGPYNRAKKPPPSSSHPFEGTLTSGSPVITNLIKVQENHNQASGSIGYSTARKAGTTIIPFEESTPIPLPAKTAVKEADGREIGRKSGPFALTGTTAAGGTVFNLTKAEEKGLVNGAVAMFDTGAPTTVTNDEPNKAILVLTAYYVVGATANSFQLAFFEGGTAVKIGVEVNSSNASVSLLEMQTKVQAEKKEAVTNPFSPGKSKLISITLDQNATENYTGKLRGRKAAREQKAWALGEGPAKAAAWPITVKVPAGKYTQVSTNSSGGGLFTIALHESKKVVAWGSSAQGQVGQGGTKFGDGQFAIEGKYVVKTTGSGELEGIVWIGTGEETCYAINEAGEAFIWGSLQNGLGQGREEGGKLLKHTAKPEKITGLPTGAGKRPAEIRGTRSAAFCRMEDGIVYSWGNNDKAELGNGTTGGESPTPTEIPGLTKVTKIACGRYHAGAIKEDGSLWLWGANESGEQGNGEAKKLKIPEAGSGQPVNKPKEVSFAGKKVLDVALGEYNGMVVLEGTVPVKNIFKAKLRREGEAEGEAKGSLTSRWESTVKTGWKFKYKLLPKWWVLAALEGKIREIEAEQDEGEAEEPEAQEELEELEAEREELTSAAKSPDEPITPVEVEPNVWEAPWKPKEATLSINKAYTVELANASALWLGARVETPAYWLSPYSK